MIRAVMIACATFGMLSLIGVPNAESREPLRTDAPVLFKANQLRNEQKTGHVIATGNVEFTQGNRTLLADSVTYDRRNDTVSANGNISILEPTGEVIFADHVELTGDLRNGIIENIRVRLTDNARVAAAGARRVRGQRTEFRKAVYSPCKLCEEDPTRAPIWQIKAFKVTHDQDSKDVTYRDAFMEFYGIPILYTPYLSHPDPTVERRTGFLTPSYGVDSELGTLVNTPFYVDIAPNMDATLKPLFTSQEGIVGGAEFRHRLSRTDYQLNGSLTHASREENQPDEFRGHIAGEVRHEFNSTWRGGGDLHLATDDTFLRRYGFNAPETLENRLYAEGFRGRNYASANAYYFQGQRSTDVQGEIPTVFPKLDYNHVSEPSRHGGLWKLDANVLGLTRRNSSDARRISAKTKWELPHISRHGEIYRTFASLQTDAYWVDDVVESDAPSNKISGLSGRIFPQVGLDWRLPLARTARRFTQTVEPVIGVVVAPGSQNPDGIPNEDSLGFEFDDTNLLSENRFAGLDRVEGGSRINYGLNSGVFDTGGGFSSFFIGQSYRLDTDADFGAGTGLDDHFSDIVGRVQIAPIRYLKALYRFRLDKDSFAPRRNEVESTFGVSEAQFTVNYLSVDQQDVRDITDSEDAFPDREEITVALSSQVTERWRFGTRARHDLTSTGGVLSRSAFLTYADDCFQFDINFSRTYTRDRDVKPSDTILFRVVFRTLGEAKTSTSRGGQ